MSFTSLVRRFQFTYAPEGKVEQHDHPDVVKYFALGKTRPSHAAVNQSFHPAQTFEHDFGHPFTAHDADDGLDEHFKRMASHAATAQSLTDDAAKLTEILSQPLNFTIDNPYREGETRADFDDSDFDAKCMCRRVLFSSN